MRRWFGLIAFLLSWNAFAEGDLKSLDWAAQDNPKIMRPDIEKELAATDPDQNPRRWVRLLWVYTRILGDGHDNPDLRELLLKGRRIAEAEKMFEEYLAFETLLPTLVPNENHDPEASRAAFEALLIKARQIGIKRLEAEALAAYAFYLYDIGESIRSLQLMIDANKILAEDPDATEFNRMNMKSNLAHVYYHQKQDTNAKALLLEIDEFCRRVTLRNFCLINDYNLGRLLVDRLDLNDVRGAEPYLQKALRVARELEDDWTLATTYTSLMTLHSRLGRHDLAIPEAEKAIQIFKAMKSAVWLADTYKKMSATLIGARRYRDALSAIEEARQLFPEGYRRDFNDLDYHSYEAYRGLGDTRRALAYLEKYSSELKTMTEAKQKSDYAKLMVELGLQVQEERNKVLLKDNEITNKQLAETERTRLFIVGMLGLSLIVIASMGLAVLRSRQATASRMKMQRILSNIEEGILTINQQLEIESEYSRHLNVLLETDGNLTGQPALPLILDRSHLNAEQKSMVAEALRAAIGEDELQWSLVEYHLPPELFYWTPHGKSILLVHWQPLFGSQSQVESVLIGLKDVTEQRKLEAEIALEKQRSDRQVHLIQELARVEPARVDSLLLQMQRVSVQFPAVEHDEERLSMLRELHTIKGIARTLGLHMLSAETHGLEDVLLSYKSPAANPQDPFKPFVAIIDECLSIVQEIFGRQIQGGYRDRSLADLVHTILPPLLDHMREAGIELCSLDISDHVLPWPKDLLPLLEQVLIHALSNSADHGFILPKQRGRTVARPGFQIAARRLSHSMEVLVRDNGAGLDLQRLQELAERLDFQPLPGRSIADVVFLDGSSTAETVSRTSGRGIGLAAIRSLCEQVGGEAHLEPAPFGAGTQLTVLIPLAAEVKS